MLNVDYLNVNNTKTQNTYFHFCPKIKQLEHKKSVFYYKIVLSKKTKKNNKGSKMVKIIQNIKLSAGQYIQGKNDICI